VLLVLIEIAPDGEAGDDLVDGADDGVIGVDGGSPQAAATVMSAAAPRQAAETTKRPRDDARPVVRKSGTAPSGWTVNEPEQPRDESAEPFL
jgi:hypothetical protein